MASWIFWYVYVTIAYTLISVLFIWINRFPIKLHYELWRGRKMINIWKRGQVIVDYDIVLDEGKLGIEKDSKTYKVDDKKGLRFKRLPIHIFDLDNIVELDFADTKNVYSPLKIDPVVYQKAILRALASGVNDSPYKNYIIIGLIILVVIGIGSLIASYLGYQNYVLLHDYLLKTGIITV